MMHKCPHCGEACMSSLRKLFIGPAGSISCMTCGKGVTIRWRHTLGILVPGVLVLLTLHLLELEQFHILLIGSALVAVAAFVQLRLLPLSKDRF